MKQIDIRILFLRHESRAKMALSFHLFQDVSENSGEMPVGKGLKR